MNVRVLAWVRFAIKLEEKGLGFYKECLAATNNEGGKALFEFLVNEEERHRKELAIVLEGLENDNPDKIVDSIEEFRKIKAKVPMFKKKEIVTVAGEKSSLAEMLNKAIAFEEEGIVFYSDIAMEEDDKVLKMLLNKLAEDEEVHKETIIKAGKELLGTVISYKG
jgi:rubrerythrin